MKQLLYIANWKMNMPLKKAHAFYTNNNKELSVLNKKADIVLCPSFVALGSLSNSSSKQNAVYWGAQNCASHELGAFTGEVDALTLQQIGCTYCIVGHSERRQLFGETNETIARKTALLYKNDITPITCIGETQDERNQDKTQAILETQLKPILDVCRTNNAQKLVLAYEPIWAIGTGVIPTPEELSETFTWLTSYASNVLPNTHIRFVYGGSVSQKNIQTLKNISLIDGFLVGGASCDFQTFKNIVG